MKVEKKQKNVNNCKKLKESIKGITLIALVITIIVLLILAGVSIATLTGNNGILTKANNAKIETEKAEVKEQAQLDIANWTAEKLKNGEDATLNDAVVKNILETANANNENPYYEELQTDKIITPSGYEISYEELYTTNTTEVTVANYGDRVNYISKGDSSLIWRIFYDDENYVYLISSKEDGSNTVDKAHLSQFPGSTKEYLGSEDVEDNFLKSLNSEWFEILETSPNTDHNAKVLAYLMDQDIWKEYKDEKNNASYAIGGPTFELFMNSYNKSKETTDKIEMLECNRMGYIQKDCSGLLSPEFNNGIYNNGEDSYWCLASPSGAHYVRDMIGVCGIYGGSLDYIDTMYENNSTASRNLGLRPVVIIPKFKFQYSIIPET